jgi:myo-inositol-1(or 4)-monophosphatase
MARTLVRHYVETAERTARKAGAFILRHLGSLSAEEISRKQAADFVTSVDKQSERLIIETIREAFPDHGILTEESGGIEARETRWIVDPLDGTTNFIHSYPVFSVSLALEARGQLLLGTVFDPLRDELFTAVRGGGATLNGRPIKVSHPGSLGDCLITTGFPFRRKEMIDAYLDAFKGIFLKVSDLRRAGSAALDLSHLASGRCDGFFELGLSPWDVAAGAVLIEEAGGVVTDFSGGADFLRTGNVVAGAPGVHGELLKEVRRAFGGIIEK